MKKSRRIFIVLLACVLAIGSVQFAGITALASESSSTKASTTSVQYNVLLEESFEEGYESITSYGGKAGAWKIPDGKFGRSGTGEMSEINVKRNTSSNVDFNFTEPYQEQMILKVTADFLGGYVSANDTMRIDVVGLNTEHTANDDGRLSVCYLANGKIYANCMGETAARDTGATYTEGTRYVLEAIIDQANMTCAVSVYEKATGKAILENYNINPYKHDKQNYYELTHGFTGIRFQSSRGDVSTAFDLYDIKVETGEKADPWVVTENDITFNNVEGATQNWDCVSLNLDTIAIDFGEAMEESKLTTNNIYIEKAETTVKVPYTPHYESNIYTLALEETLEEDTTYNIVIKKIVTSAAGGANESDIVFSFKTEAIEMPAPESFNITLLEETFGLNYASKTSYGEKAGVWTVPDGYFGHIDANGVSEIHLLKGKEANTVFAFNEPYQEQMALKVTAEVVTGVADGENSMRIDVVGLNDVDETTDSGIISLCSLRNGKIYTNCLSVADSRDTGVTYTEGQRLIFEGIIDEANKLFTLSVYDKESGNAILENYKVKPYKHDKSNYYELTHGFTGIRFTGKRASDAGQAFELHDIKVMTIGEEIIDPDRFNATLFEETFEAGYESTTSYGGKTGTWIIPEGKFNRGGEGEMSEINVARSTSSNVDFNFAEPYQEQMVLKVTADFLGGVADGENSMRIDVVGLSEGHENNDDGRISVCYLTNGKIYTNCIGEAASRDTGATYTEGTRYVLEAIIDQANKTCTVSVYEKETGNIILENYDIDPYKHDKSNYYELTHGFTGIRFASKRANVSTAFDLYDISVMTIVEEIPDTDPFNVNLFEETFEKGYVNTTRYSGKTGAWKIPNGIFNEGGAGEASEIHALRDTSGNIDFNFAEPYQEQMVLKVTAEVVAGVADSNNNMRIDVVGLNTEHTANDDGRITLCYLTNGKIYANCMGVADARDTGATYTEGQRLTFEGIIDEANKTFTLSVYDKETGAAILSGYNVNPYKHTKDNYYELTHGFTGIRFQTKRASDADQAFELYDITVRAMGEEIPEGTFAEITDVAVDGSAVNGLSQVSTGDKITITVDYTNSTYDDKTLFLIVACYNENCLTNFSYVTKDVAGYIRTNEIEIESKEIDTAGADKMKIMVWDGFITLGALSSIKTID